VSLQQKDKAMPEPALRRCLREPIPEIFAAAALMRDAVAAHLSGDRRTCAALIAKANDQVVRDWACSLMGTDPEKNPFVQLTTASGVPPILPKAERIEVGMPSAATRAELIRRHGHRCAYCGIPLVRAEVRKALHATYPDEATWDPHDDLKSLKCHAALLCMWLQFDHVLPHSRGGDNSPANLVLSCAPCNYGRMAYSLAEVGLLDPRIDPWTKTDWDGLEPFLRPLAGVSH
jgi:5-methylcytosine-specific restriction endonuclease McrA